MIEAFDVLNFSMFGVNVGAFSVAEAGVGHDGAHCGDEDGGFKITALNPCHLQMRRNHGHASWSRGG